MVTVKPVQIQRENTENTGRITIFRYNPVHYYRVAAAKQFQLTD